MKKFLIALIILIGIVLFFEGGRFWIKITAVPDEIIQTDFVITSGESVREIGNNLKEAGIIVDGNSFYQYVKYRGFDAYIKSGTYNLFSASIKDLVPILLVGPTREEVVLRFLEGWTIEDMDEYLFFEGVTEKGDFLNAINEAIQEGILDEYDWGNDFNISDEVTLEGFLFPDTYRFYKGVSPLEIVYEMVETFDKRFDNDLKTDALKSGHSLFEIITIASILEREVRSEYDKALVADIIYKRLDIGMALQMDSTVNYVTGSNRDRILYTDRDIESPYNTYKYTGLPIGPISAPGLESIRAAIYPVENSYYYFLTDGNGGVHYANTHEEHVANRQFMN